MSSVTASRRRAARSAGWLIAVAVTATACGSTAEDAAGEAARAFEVALAQGEAGRACSFLSQRAASELEQSSGRPCDESILEEARKDVGRARTVSVYGAAAQVVFDDDTVFLSRFADGWRVTAAACSSTTSGLYDCRIAGG